MSNYPIIVTGGAGYIGSHVCKALKAEGFTPITLDNLSRGHAASVKFGPLEKVDLLDHAATLAVLRKHHPQAVILCAGYIAVGESTTNPELYYEQNVVATLHLLSSMREAGVKHIVFSSSCAVHGIPASVPIHEDMPRAPISPYGHTKMMMEQAIEDFHRAYGLHYMILRYFNACGADAEGEIGECHEPETHLVPLAVQAALGKAPLGIFGTDYDTPDGTAIRDYIHVSDIANAHVVALRKLLADGQSATLNLGIGQGYSVKEIIQAVEKTLGIPVPTKQMPRREGDPPMLLADVTRMHLLLQFQPKYSTLSHIIETATAWEKKRKV